MRLLETPSTYDKHLKNPAWRLVGKNNMNVLYCFRVLTIADLVKETANTTDLPGVAACTVEQGMYQVLGHA